MKISHIVVSTIVLMFTLSFLFDILTTLRDLAFGCVELNPFFAPFINSPSLLFQAYFCSWFATVGLTVFITQLFRKYWYLGFSWYWLVIYWTILHFQAGYHNLLIVGYC